MFSPQPLRQTPGADAAGAGYAEDVAPTSLALRLFRIPPPGENVVGWHVSPLVDTLAYSFSWLFILIPLALSGDAHPGDYLALWAVGITVSFLHRHFTMPYVYLDGAVFETHKTRFTLIPAVLFCGFVASVMLQHARIPKEFFSTKDVGVFVTAVAVVAHVWWHDRQGQKFSNRQLLAALAPFVVAVVLGGFGVFVAHHDVGLAIVGVCVVFAAFIVCGARIAAATVVGLVAAVAAASVVSPLNDTKLKGSIVVGAAAMVAAMWNIWHTSAQKVGILRVYNAKSTAPVEQKVPLWVDRLLVLGWFPLLGALLVTRERETILTQGKVVAAYLTPLIDGITAVAPVLLPLGALLVVVSIAVFLRYEWNATRLQSKPRLVMALGMTLLSASFLFVSPLKCYVAYGFSHAIEYVVFVWAYQRRRYATPHSPVPVMQRLMRYSVIFYSIFALVIGGTYFVVEFGASYGLFEGKVKLFGYGVGLWLYAWAIWHSLTHFYFDGFLWKMRAPTVRAHL